MNNIIILHYHVIGCNIFKVYIMDDDIITNLSIFSTELISLPNLFLVIFLFRKVLQK